MENTKECANRVIELQLINANRDEMVAAISVTMQMIDSSCFGNVTLKITQYDD